MNTELRSKVEELHSSPRGQVYDQLFNIDIQLNRILSNNEGDLTKEECQQIMSAMRLIGGVWIGMKPSLTPIHPE